jgi:hypothetical protein
LRELISNIAEQKGAVRILDLGGSIEYWNRVGLDFLRINSAQITVLNHIEAELKAKDSDEVLFTTTVGDACDLSMFETGSFDLVHSNSVIEHVGDWSRMRAFSEETRRVGMSYYAQTPYYWFPIDPHFYRAPMIHWLPRPWRAGILHRLPVARSGRIPTLDATYRILDHTRLLDRRQFEIAFPDAVISRERIFGFTKSLVAIREA